MIEWEKGDRKLWSSCWLLIHHQRDPTVKHVYTPIYEIRSKMVDWWFDHNQLWNNHHLRSVCTRYKPTCRLVINWKWTNWKKALMKKYGRNTICIGNEVRLLFTMSNGGWWWWSGQGSLIYNDWSMMNTQASSLPLYGLVYIATPKHRYI